MFMSTAGGTNFLIVAVLTFLVGTKGRFARQWVLTLLVVAWSVRLAGFLLYRIILWGEDRRFDEKRNNIGQLAIFWTLQAIWVWTVSLPVTILNASARNPPLGGVDYFGWFLFSAGLLLESVADMQKLNFKRDESSRGKWIDVGVWKWSRHPNYFGEIVVWCGAFVSASRVFVGVDWIAVLGPIFITLLLLFVSGVTLTEQSADKKHGGKEDYWEYKNRTSVLYTIPPALYAPIPTALKRTIFLDFPLYNDESGRGSGAEKVESSPPTESDPIVPQ